MVLGESMSVYARKIAFICALIAPKILSWAVRQGERGILEREKTALLRVPGSENASIGHVFATAGRMFR